MSEELVIISRSYDLLRWTLEHTVRFDRVHRHGIGRRLETQLHDLLELLIEAKFSRQKEDAPRSAGFRLEQARLLFRLAKDLRLLAINSYAFAAEQLTDISKQLSAWRRSSEQR